MLAGFGVLWVLRMSFVMVAGTALSSLFPPGEPATTAGLVVSLVSDAVDGIAAGLVASRIAGTAPMAHAGILAGLFGFMGLRFMDQATGMPGWYAIGFALAAPLGALAGGAIASLLARRGTTKRP